MLGVIHVDVFGNLRGCRARSPMFAKPCLQGSFCLTNVYRIAFFTFDLEVLTTEPRWFERGVKEAIYIRALNPSLNRDGGRYNLPPVWDNIIKKRVKADRPRRGGASSSPSRTASQTTSPGRLNWWSWQPSAKALVSWFYIILSIKCTKNCVISKPG